MWPGGRNLEPLGGNQMREEGKGVCDAVSRVKVGGAGSGKLSGPLGCVCEGLPISRVRVGGIAGEGRRQPPRLPHPSTHPPTTDRGLLAGPGAGRCGRAPGARGAARSRCGRQEAASARAARGSAR